MINNPIMIKQLLKDFNKIPKKIIKEAVKEVIQENKGSEAMSYCRTGEAEMYIYPDGEGIDFMVMPEELGGRTYITNEQLNILLYLMSNRKHELKDRIKAGKKLYLEYKKKEGQSYEQSR